MNHKSPDALADLREIAERYTAAWCSHDADSVTDKAAREPEWPDALDAIVAAPEHHEVLLENERVRVLDSRIKPGETVPVHTHRWESVLYVLGTSHFIRYDTEGNPVFDSRTAATNVEPGTVVWSPPLRPHSVENVGDTEIRVISVELKD